MDNEIIQTRQYIDKLNSLNETINPILDEFKKIFILHKTNPQNQEYRQQYENITNNINNIESRLFIISNDIQANTDKLNKLLLNFNDNIKNEKNKNDQYKRKLGIIENKNQASIKLINNYKEMYENNYLKNWGLVISTLLCIYVISKIKHNP